MFSGMEPVAQIILSVGIFIAAIIILVLIIFRGIKVRSSVISVNVDGKKGKGDKDKKDAFYYIFSVEDMESIIDILSSFLEHIYEVSDVITLKRKMDMVENRLSLLYDHKNMWFTELLIKKKIPQNCIANHVDFLHFRQVVDRILYFEDSAVNSVKSMLRKHLRDKSYTFDPNATESENKSRFDKFVSNVTDEIVQKTKRLWNDNYHSDVVDFDGQSTKKRIVSVEEIYDFESSEESVTIQKNLFVEIFKFAIEIDSWSEKEKKRIKDDRKKQIQMFLLKRKSGT